MSTSVNCASATTLNEHTLRLQLNKVVLALISSKPFVPSNATWKLKSWLLAMRLSRAEREIASTLTKEILTEYKRRLGWVSQELETEVFKRQGD